MSPVLYITKSVFPEIYQSRILHRAPLSDLLLATTVMSVSANGDRICQPTLITAGQINTISWHTVVKAESNFIVSWGKNTKIHIVTHHQRSPLTICLQFMLKMYYTWTTSQIAKKACASTFIATLHIISLSQKHFVQHTQTFGPPQLLSLRKPNLVTYL